MTITLAGMAGAGKTTIAKMLVNELNLKRTSSSQLQRKIAEEMGLSINELAKKQSESDEMDKMVDEEARKFAKQYPNSLIDGWLAPYAVPDSFKVFLKVDTKIAAKRRVKQAKEEGRDEEKFDTIEEAEKMMIERAEDNRKRWIEFYNYDFMDESNYDLVIDTSNKTPKNILNLIVEGYKKYEQKD